MEKYRNKNVENFMGPLEDDLTAIVGKEFANLDVMGVLDRNRKENPEMTIEQATVWAMRDSAARIMRKTIALATSLDRVSVMVGQMADDMSADGNQKSELYRKRLDILTNIPKIVAELR